jgi:ribosome-binding ATPase YchF (GTP1/OBG family)
MSKYQVQARIHPTHWAHSIDKGVIHLEYVIEATDETQAREKAEELHDSNDYEVHLDDIDIHKID